MSAAIAHNLGQVMRKLTGAGKPRYLAVLAARAFSRFGLFWADWAPAVRLLKLWTHPIRFHAEFKNAIAA